MPLPDWSRFEEEDLIDVNDELRVKFRERAIPSPADVAVDPQQLVDERRYEVPITVISCEFPSSEIRTLIEQDNAYVRELAKVRDVDSSTCRRVIGRSSLGLRSWGGRSSRVSEPDP
jgi:hypothetical protein